MTKQPIYYVEPNIWNFQTESGWVPAHRHPNGGGWVANTAYVADSVHVGSYAKVFGNAQVFGDIRLLGHSKIFGNAIITKQPTFIYRSDGYSFVYVDCVDGIKRIQAGCRNFTLEEAIAHWSSETYRDKKLGKESLEIVQKLIDIWMTP